MGNEEQLKRIQYFTELHSLPMRQWLSDMTLFIEEENIRFKAQNTFNRCLREGKLELARKIAIKYNLKMEGFKDDTVLSLGLALIYQQRIANK